MEVPILGSPERSEPKLLERYEKILVYVVLISIILFMAITLMNASRTSLKNWERGISMAEKGEGPEAAALYQAAARGYDFFVVKNAALLLGYIIVALGAVLAVYGVEASYKLRLTFPQAKGSALETSSPGLVLVTIGAALVIAALMTKSSITTTTVDVPDSDNAAYADEDVKKN